MLTRQQVFDRVAAHLMSAPCRSLGRPYPFSMTRICMYRGVDGAKCAIGCLIADEHYTDAIEGCIVLNGDQGPLIRALVSSGVPCTEGDQGFLRELQLVHDRKENWGEGGFNERGRSDLAFVASIYGLSWDEAVPC